MAMPPMAGPGMPPMPGGMPGAMPGDNMSAPPMQDPMAEQALSSLDQLQSKTQSPSQALNRVTEALDLAYKLISTVLPQVSNINPKIAKDLHQISQRVLAAKMDVKKDMPSGPPPELMSGLGNLMGAPPMPGASAAGGLGGM